MSTRYENKGRTDAAPPAPPIAHAADVAQGDEAPVSINGFQQVLEMLQIADPQFRESLLRRLAARDRKLAQSLREDLLDSGV